SGDREGQSNLYLTWKSGTIVDKTDEWALEVQLIAGAPKDTCTVDLTARRCQQFKPAAGTRLVWSNMSRAQGKEIQSGRATVDAWGLVTLPQVMVGKGGNRLRVHFAP